jgi:hypothetical protein
LFAPVHYNRLYPKCKEEISKEKRFILKKAIPCSRKI